LKWLSKLIQDYGEFSSSRLFLEKEKHLPRDNSPKAERGENFFLLFL